MEQLKKQVCDYIESHEGESVKFLKRLIQEKVYLEMRAARKQLSLKSYVN